MVLGPLSEKEKALKPHPVKKRKNQCVHFGVRTTVWGKHRGVFGPRDILSFIPRSATKRMHVMLRVKALDEATRFYSRPFDAGPIPRKTCYAKWMLDDVERKRRRHGPAG